MLSVFLKCFSVQCADRGTTPFKVALDAGVDPSLMSGIVSGRRILKPDQMKKFINQLSKSKLLKVDETTLLAWWALDLFPMEVLKKAIRDKTIERIDSQSMSYSTMLKKIPLSKKKT